MPALYADGVPSYAWAPTTAFVACLMTGDRHSREAGSLALQLIDGCTGVVRAACPVDWQHHRKSYLAWADVQWSSDGSAICVSTAEWRSSKKGGGVVYRINKFVLAFSVDS